MAKKFLTALDLAGNQIVKLRAENLASLPAFGSAGRIVYNTTDSTLNFDTGAAWVTVGAAGSVAWGDITGKPATFPPDAHNHPISEVTGLQAALDAKAPTANPTFTGTVSGVTKAHVGLGNVDNTSDANKPISTATQTALDGKAATSHTHTAAQITDLAAAVNALITQYFDDATADTTRDTLVELIGLITSNESAIATLQAKADVYAVTGPGSAGTSMTVTHNLNTTDVIVQVFEVATSQLVACDVTITSANVVTLGFGASQAQNTLRCVVMG